MKWYSNSINDWIEDSDALLGNDEKGGAVTDIDLQNEFKNICTEVVSSGKTPTDCDNCYFCASVSNADINDWNNFDYCDLLKSYVYIDKKPKCMMFNFTKLLLEMI